MFLKIFIVIIIITYISIIIYGIIDIYKILFKDEIEEKKIKKMKINNLKNKYRNVMIEIFKPEAIGPSSLFQEIFKRIKNSDRKWFQFWKPKFINPKIKEPIEIDIKRS